MPGSPRRRRPPSFPAPFFCPGAKLEATKSQIQHEAQVTAEVEKAKAAVQCSRLWVRENPTQETPSHGELRLLCPRLHRGALLPSPLKPFLLHGADPLSPVG